MRLFARMRGGWLLGRVVLAGCSSPSGGKLTLFPEGHRLMESAQMLRDISHPPPGMPRELDKCVATPYTVEPGDVLLAQPGNLDSPIRLPGDQPVLPDGTIQLGRYGRLSVAGKTVSMIEAEVNALIKSQAPDAGAIIVRLVTRDSKIYYVLGEVNAPGSFQLKGRETVLDAIVAAGGLNSNASRRSIILVRPTAPESCRLVLPVHYNAIVQLGDTATNYQIRSGDRVYVASKSLWDDLKNCLGNDHKHDQGPMPVPCYPDPPACLGQPLPVMAGPPVHEVVQTSAELPASLGKPEPDKPPSLVLPPGLEPAQP
jgi:protein involved in polysaccharide export with SLBB domain